MPLSSGGKIQSPALKNLLHYSQWEGQGYSAAATTAITSPEKVMLPERGETKLDLARYYVAVGDALMGTVRDRPTLLQRLAFQLFLLARKGLRTAATYR